MKELDMAEKQLEDQIKRQNTTNLEETIQMSVQDILK